MVNHYDTEIDRKKGEIILHKKQNSVLVASIVVVSLLIVVFGFIFKEQNSKLNSLYKDYNKLNEKHQQLINEYEELTSPQKVMTEKIDDRTQENVSFIQRYDGMKYPVASGIRRYIGEEPLRIYPNSEAPFVYDNYKPVIVELINEVALLGKQKQENWCLVLDSRGVSGYAQRKDLVKVDQNDEYISKDYGNGLESLGGFKVGDRIETLIGLLDRDYYLIYENSRIYQFPDNNSKEVSDPKYRPFTDINSLDAFVGYANRVGSLRTDSPEFPLKDGYKVGDNAIKVLDFYSSKYNKLDDSDLNWLSEYTFVLEENHLLEFYIDTEKLNQNSVISSIEITSINKE